MQDPAGKNYRLAEFTYPILPEHKGGAMWFYSLPEHDNLCHPAAGRVGAEEIILLTLLLNVIPN